MHLGLPLLVSLVNLTLKIIFRADKKDVHVVALNSWLCNVLTVTS